MCVCLLTVPSKQNPVVLSSSALLVYLIKAQLQDASSSSSSSCSQQMDRCRVITFLGVCKAVPVCITQRILLKSRPPSVLNTGLISSLPSCRYAWRPLNGHSGCYGRPGLSHLLLPVGILLKSSDWEGQSFYVRTHTNMHAQIHSTHSWKIKLYSTQRTQGHMHTWIQGHGTLLCRKQRPHAATSPHAMKQA